jgi:hypothetical protein
MMPRSALCSLIFFLALLSHPLFGGEPPRLDRYSDPLPPGAIARMGTERLRVDFTFIIFSADGKTVFSADRESLREWKTATGEQQKRRLTHYDDVAVSANRKLLALTAIERKSQRIDLWEPGSAKTRRSLEYKGKDLIRAVAFSPDGKHLISIHNHCYHPDVNRGRIDGEDGLHVWDLDMGKELRKFHTSAAGIYSQLVITPDGRTAIAGSVNGHVNCLRPPCIGSTAAGGGQLYLWDLRSGREIRRLEGHRWAIRALALSGDGWLLASADASHSVRLWELISGKTLFDLPVDAANHPAMALSPDGRLVAIGTDSSLRVHSTTTGKTVLNLRGHNAKVRCVAFSPDNQLLASGLSDGTALVWDVSAACRAVQPEARRLNQKELEALWADLADADALKAHRAIASLITAGEDAAGMLKERLRPAEDVAPKRLQKLLTDLNADEFAVREAATRELEKLGEQAEPALSDALKDRPALEVRKRIEDLLAHLYSREVCPERLRELRAVRVLEQIGSAEARAILQSLAKGSADARLTQEAKASLARVSSGKSEPRP